METWIGDVPYMDSDTTQGTEALSMDELKSEDKENYALVKSEGDNHENIVRIDVRKSKQLIVAATKGFVQKVITLLSEGASMWYRDEDNNTALHYAADGGHNEVITILLQHSV